MNETEKTLKVEIERLTAWINDLQSGMFINCVYCGHRYGPSKTTPVSMADVLKEHIGSCPKHPMSSLRAERDALREENEQLRSVDEVRLCDVENCNLDVSSGGAVWCETGYWMVCSLHARKASDGEPQPIMKRKAVIKESLRLPDGRLPANIQELIAAVERGENGITNGHD